MKLLNFFLIWIFGFVALLSFDFFFEFVVFEFLKWNGTSKNDWFFILWWVLVLIWFLMGLKTLYQISKKTAHKSRLKLLS